MKSLFFLSLIAITHVLAGQNYVNLARLDYNYGLPSAYQNNPGENGRVSEWALDLTLPIVISSTFSIISGVNTEWIKTNIYQNETEENLYSIMAKVGVNIKHSDRLVGTYILLPKVVSDLQAIGSMDYQIGGIGLLKFTKNQSLNYKIGLYLNSDLFGPMIVPIFGLYKKSGRFEANLSLPINADFNYQLNQDFNLGLRFVGINKSFHLNRPIDQYVVKINNEIGPYIQWAIGDLNIRTQIGTTVLRSFRTYEMNDRVNYSLSLFRPNDNRNQLNQDFKDGLFIKTSLIYRLTFDE